MSREVVDPVVTQRPDAGPGRLGETVTTHPAYGQISASRISGRTALYGSDFEHNGFVSIKIQTSELNRHTGRDWPYAKKTIVEVWLSEAQWAHFVSAMNIGDGGPCTIYYNAADGGYQPQLPAPIDEASKFKEDLLGHMEKALVALRKLRTEGKLRKSDLDLVNTAVREIVANSPYTEKQFDEHVETRMEKAKMEVEAYFNRMVQAAGFEALGATMPIRTIEYEGHPRANDED